ncbi:hypothetical protein DZJ_40960 [Dickeya ananatis]
MKVLKISSLRKVMSLSVSMSGSLRDSAVDGKTVRELYLQYAVKGELDGASRDVWQYSGVE